MSETTYYRKNREVILNKAKDYYENNKELLRERERERERGNKRQQQNIKREYGRKRYHNMSEENKKRLKEYQKIIMRLKNVFHKCKYINKSVLQNCYCKDIFCSFFY